MKLFHLVVLWTLLLLFNSVNASADLLTGGDAVFMNRSSAGDMYTRLGFTCGDSATSVEYPAGTSVEVTVAVIASSCKATADIVVGETRIIAAYIPFDSDMYYRVRATYPITHQLTLYNTDCQSQSVATQIIDCKL